MNATVKNNSKKTSVKKASNKLASTNNKTTSITVDVKKGIKTPSIYKLRINVNSSLKDELYSLNQVVKFIKEQAETNNTLHVYLLAIKFDVSKLTTKLIVDNWLLKNDAGKLCYNYKGIIKEKSKFSIWDVLKVIEKL